MVDDKEVDNKYYTVKEGSTIVTLSKDYLSALKEGTHTLSIISSNGTAETTFTIVKSDVTIPDTGNTVSIDYLLPATIIMASGIAIIYGLKKRRRS